LAGTATGTSPETWFVSGTNETLGNECTLRIEQMLGASIVWSQKITTGHSAAQRWLIGVASRTRYFVKIGATLSSAKALRHEAWVYERLHLRCMPELVAWQDHETAPILVVEDLSSLEWPPPWSERTITLALDAIERIHAADAPLLPYVQRNGPDWAWWRAVEREPEPFLRLNIVSRGWLQSSLPILIGAADAVNPTGECVTHFDLRSDNFCFASDHARVVDWSLACIGNPTLDLGLFLPGLASESGPRPEHILPKEPGIAAWVAGFFAWHASKPFIPEAPRVRTMQRRLLQQALPWAIRELHLQTGA
jgi:hypothetical protein